MQSTSDRYQKNPLELKKFGHVNIKREVSLLLLRMSGFSQQTKEMLHLFPFTQLHEMLQSCFSFHYNTETPCTWNTNCEAVILPYYVDIPHIYLASYHR